MAYLGELYEVEPDFKAHFQHHISGFDEYRIIHRCSEGNGKFKYSAVHTEDEIPVELRISGASPTRDPLKEIQLIKLRVDNDKFIIGIDDSGDCVVKK